MSLSYKMPEGINNSPKTTITNNPLESSSGSITVTDVTKLNTSGVSSTNYQIATLGTGDTAEVVKITGVSGNTLTVERGAFGTSAQTWVTGTEIYRAFTKYDHDAMRNNIASLDTDKLDKTGDGSTVTAAFSSAETRANIVSGTSLSTIFGKVMKYFADLKALAFKDKIASGDITAGAIATADISDDAVTSAKIADSTITAGNLSDGAVTTDKIYDANVTTAKLASNSVTADKIPDGSVTRAKLVNGAVHDNPDGGAINQVLKKTTATSYEYTWGTVNFGELGGNATDNSSLSTALSAKANTADLGDLASKDTVSIASGSTDITGTLPIANGGTGASNATAARLYLGAASEVASDGTWARKRVTVDDVINYSWAALGTLASASSVSLAGTEVTGTLPLSKGGLGTSCSTVADARTALGGICAKPDYEYDTTDLTEGTSSLETGKLYFYYEAA